MTPTRYTGAGAQPTVAKAAPHPGTGTLAAFSPPLHSNRVLSAPHIPSPAGGHPARNTLIIPCQGTQPLSSAEITLFPRFLPKTGLSRAQPGWKTGPQLFPSCQTKGRKRFAGRAGQGFESHALNCCFKAEMRWKSRLSGRKGLKEDKPGAHGPSQMYRGALGKAGGCQTHPNPPIPEGKGKLQQIPWGHKPLLPSLHRPLSGTPPQSPLPSRASSRWPRDPLGWPVEPRCRARPTA